MFKKAFFILLLCTFCVQPLFAQEVISDTSNKIGVGIKTDYMSSNSYSYRDRDIDRESQALIGGIITYGVNRWLSLELSYEGALSGEIKDKTLDVKLADFDVSPLTVSAQFRYISSNPEVYKWIVPYLTAGIGYYFVDGDLSDSYKTYNAPNDTSLDFDGGFGAHIGLGTDFFIKDNVSMGIEAKFFKFTAKIKETQYNPILDVTQSHKEDLDMDGWIMGVNFKVYFKVK